MRRGTVLLALAGNALVIALACSGGPSLPSGGQSFPSSFDTSTIDGLPASCSGQTYFEGSTAFCIGVTYVLCSGGSYGGYACSPPNGWTLETGSADQIASAPRSCSSDGTAPHGSVYVESDVPAPGKSTILQFRYCDGTLLPIPAAVYTTGGTGSHDLADRGVLDADQQVIVSPDQSVLYAVNQGSDTIAAYRIAADGSLSGVPGAPFPSGGKAPASLGISGDMLVVANKAVDGVRNLGGATPKYTTFKRAPSGALTPTGWSFNLPGGSSPTQVMVPGNGNLVFATEESGVLRAMQLLPSGELVTAPGSPVGLPNDIFVDGGRPVPVWPAGLSSHGSYLYTGIPNYGSVAAYSFTAAGELTFVSNTLEPEAALPCWSVTNSSGTRLYFANAGSADVSVWDTSDPGHPTWMQTAALPGYGNPWGLKIDPSGTLLFVIAPRQVGGLTPINDGQLLHGFHIDSDGTLVELPGSPVPVPAPQETNILGVAVVADR